MGKIRFGVICPSKIAFRRFMPAFKKNANAEFIGVASPSRNEWQNNSPGFEAERLRAESFVTNYGGKLFNSYEALISSPEIEAVYIPLPPGLHYEWSMKTLLHGKHIMVEKPFTTSLDNTLDVINFAKSKKLAVHENYMFIYHTQLDYIKEQLSRNIVGDIRLYRIEFGFPFRGGNDFRYIKALGGGVLHDCAGYTVKLASLLLGESAVVAYSRLNYSGDFEVDIFGNATLENKDGVTAQISFGMDNDYRCSLEVRGSTGSIFTNRIFTAPVDYEPVITIKTGEDEKSITLQSDDTFKKSIENFISAILGWKTRERLYQEIEQQAQLTERMVVKK